jgi:tetratricopeptide (TPR) repeat protein
MFLRARRLGALATAAMLLVATRPARSQEKTARPDPQLAAIFKAEGDGRLADADKLLSAALQDAERNAPESRRMSLLLSHLASVRQRQGRLPDAIAATKQRLALDEKIFGPESPNGAGDLSALGMYCTVAGDDAVAEHAYKRGLAIARQSPGPRAEVLLLRGNKPDREEQQSRPDRLAGGRIRSPSRTSSRRTRF